MSAGGWDIVRVSEAKQQLIRHVITIAPVALTDAALERLQHDEQRKAQASKHTKKKRRSKIITFKKFLMDKGILEDENQYAEFAGLFLADALVHRPASERDLFTAHPNPRGAENPTHDQPLQIIGDAIYYRPTGVPRNRDELHRLLLHKATGISLEVLIRDIVSAKKGSTSFPPFVQYAGFTSDLVTLTRPPGPGQWQRALIMQRVEKVKSASTKGRSIVQAELDKMGPRLRDDVMKKVVEAFDKPDFQQNLPDEVRITDGEMRKPMEGILKLLESLDEFTFSAEMRPAEKKRASEVLQQINVRVDSFQALVKQVFESMGKDKGVKQTASVILSRNLLAPGKKGPSKGALSVLAEIRESGEKIVADLEKSVTMISTADGKRAAKTTDTEGLFPPVQPDKLLPQLIDEYTGTKEQDPKDGVGAGFSVFPLDSSMPFLQVDNELVRRWHQVSMPNKEVLHQTVIESLRKWNKPVFTEGHVEVMGRDQMRRQQAMRKRLLKRRQARGGID
ncbi:hypothetical protein J8273_2753 [Carpediemonas membranifera]|uniref:Uncharacterized protein n=1 Tax=Carpediemonas membranifera TaxID=201153 RepID=A0A8J6BZT4_9EUKA|nr:hypothetical protein J8273_2753 [Carpediemonas membranifera]|eukprot:KAG9395841.1 hypothetical protein J8273_2753 [Carpediemonas membranifera]